MAEENLKEASPAMSVFRKKNPFFSKAKKVKNIGSPLLIFGFLAKSEGWTLCFCYFFYFFTAKSQFSKQIRSLKTSACRTAMDYCKMAFYNRQESLRDPQIFGDMEILAGFEYLTNMRAKIPFTSTKMTKKSPAAR